MGTDIEAVLAIDDNSPADGPPFVNTPSFWDLTQDFRLSGGKHYEFYAAIAGIRDETGIPPLIPPRGAPPYLQSEDPARASPDEVSDYWLRLYPALDSVFGHPVAGWLTLAEIEAAMRHHGLDRSRLDASVLLVLDAMEAVERRYGRDRVHLLFGIE